MHRENEDLLNYLSAQVKRLPVELKLGQETTPELIEGMNSDATILAVGSSFAPSQLPGSDRRNVITIPQIMQLASGNIKGDVAARLRFQRRLVLRIASPLLRNFSSPSVFRRLSNLLLPLGGKIAIIGGNFIGCQLAQFLAEKGKEVVVLESGRRVAVEMPIPLKWITMEQLRHNGVVILTGVKCEEITDDGVIINTKDGGKQTIQVNSVVLVAGNQPGGEYVQRIQGKDSQVYVAGDCAEIGSIEGSIASALNIAARI